MSTRFTPRATKYLKKHPEAAVRLEEIFALLRDDINHPRLKTHKLKGEYEEFFSCSGGYGLRVTFELIENDEAIFFGIIRHARR